MGIGCVAISRFSSNRYHSFFLILSNWDTHGGKYSALFQSCPWLKELPFEPPGMSDMKDDRTLKGRSHFTSGSHINRNIIIICISYPVSHYYRFFKTK